MIPWSRYDVRLKLKSQFPPTKSKSTTRKEGRLRGKVKIQSKFQVPIGNNSKSTEIIFFFFLTKFQSIIYVSKKIIYKFTCEYMHKWKFRTFRVKRKNRNAVIVTFRLSKKERFIRMRSFDFDHYGFISLIWILVEIFPNQPVWFELLYLVVKNKLPIPWYCWRVLNYHKGIS